MASSSSDPEFFCDKLVIDFLLHAGLVDVAFKLIKESFAEVQLEQLNSEEIEKLKARQMIFEYISKGDVFNGLNLLRTKFLGILEKFEEQHFHLKIQIFIEMLRQNDVLNAVRFCKSEVYCLVKNNDRLQNELEEVLLLTIKENPQDDPAFSADRRLSLALEVNQILMPEGKRNSLLSKTIQFIEAYENC